MTYLGTILPFPEVGDKSVREVFDAFPALCTDDKHTILVSVNIFENLFYFRLGNKVFFGENKFR